MDELLATNVKIENASIQTIELPFNTPVHLPFGTINTRPSAWLSIEGRVDGGEVTPGTAEGTALPMQIPMYDDYSGNLALNINRILASINGHDILFSEILTSISELELGGSYATARMTVEAAILDMIGHAKGLSVLSMISGMEIAGPLAIPYGKSIAENKHDTIISACDVAVNNGAKRLKFKLSPQNYAELYPALQYIRSRYRNIDCMVDANGMFDPEDQFHLDMLTQIDSLGLLTIEEPVSRAGRLHGLLAYEALKNVLNLHTPITMDDAIKHAEDARIALDRDLAQIVNLKPGRVGSFIECVNIAQDAKQRNKEIMVGGMFEATPGRMMTLTLAAYCLELGFQIPGDLSLPQDRLDDDLIDTKLRLNRRQEVIFNPGSGWGYDL